MPLHKLVGEACVIDVPPWGKDDRDYLITVEDIHKWETVHGPLHENCIIIVRTGRVSSISVFFTKQRNCIAEQVLAR